MEKVIYVKLLDERTEVFRPVTAIKIKDNIYKLKGAEVYDTNDEKWEFIPGTYVFIEERKLRRKIELVAEKKHIKSFYS